ncbi:MAG: glycosyltransferase [Paludibacteraceae bacterium]|nr:glycosyltransferase [Paludibacteraceae bacterium]
MNLQNKNIVILTDPFGKPLYVPRMRFLADFLTQKGYNVEVFSEYIEPINFQHSYPITTYKFNTSKLSWALNSLLTLLFDYKNKWFAQKVCKACENKQIDIVLVSTSYTFPLYAGQQLAKQHNARLITDLRDIAEQSADNQLISHQQWYLKPIANLYRRFNIKRRNKIIKTADAITTISPWHQEFLKKINLHTYLIYNGYDEKEFFPDPQQNKQFSIIYTGKIYSNTTRNPQLLFEALAEIMQTNDIPQLEINWYVDKKEQTIIKQWAEHYNLNNIMNYHDYVPRNEINQLINQAAIVLVLSNIADNQHQHGIMTTKFYEALGAKRPILLVRSDEECLEKIMIETNAGCAARNSQQAKQFITQIYKEWKTNNGITLQNNQSENFNRTVQSEKFINIFNQF